MVCDRCIKVVGETFSNNDMNVTKGKLGEVILNGDYDLSKLRLVNEQLIKEGFEIIFDQDEQLVNEIKSLIIDAIHHKKLDLNKISTYLSDHLNISYSKLSTMFSKSENKTIEAFTIEHRIEKAKELLSYHELTISEISYQLNYSSPQHLARQFKKITGITPTEYIQSGERKKLDTI